MERASGEDSWLWEKESLRFFTGLSLSECHVIPAFLVPALIIPCFCFNLLALHKLPFLPVMNEENECVMPD